MIHERDQRVGKVEKVRKKENILPTPPPAKDYCLYLEFVSDMNGR